MRIRERTLPYGWYPESLQGIREEVRQWEASELIQTLSSRKTSCSKGLMLPHAGWFFSGMLSWMGMMTVSQEPETVIVLGGHLPSNSPSLFALEDSFATPAGLLAADVPLRDSVVKACEREGMILKEDRYQDNTIEVLLPLIAFRWPKVKTLCLRAPNGLQSVKLGSIIAHLRESTGCQTLLIASTDLTHYGPNYDFQPSGTGKRARDWVKSNDKGFIDAVLSGDEKDVYTYGNEKKAACSCGPVLAALGFLKTHAELNAELLSYRTSLDIMEGDSFVGYAAIAFL